jgi:chemotaxis protein MotB
VVRRLVGGKIEPTHLRAVGHADTEPVADNATPEGRALNRRVNLVLQGGDERPF